MATTIDPSQITKGTEIYASDGDMLGKAAGVEANAIVVEKGFFFPTDYYVPMSAVASMEGGNVYLNVTKDAALNKTWDITSATETEGLTLQLHEEELTATKRAREIGEVRIDKEVVSEQRTIEVPVTEERVRVQRHAVDRPLGADEVAFEGGTIEVPLMGEEVHLQKQARVSEEIEIGKEAVQRTEQVGGTVRREEVRVTETGETGQAATAATTPSKRNRTR